MMDEVIERKWGEGLCQNVEKNTSILNSNKNHKLDSQFQIGISLQGNYKDYYALYLYG